MALFQWDDSYSVGIAVIDEQHRKLVGMINTLDDAMRQGRGKSVLSGILSEMVRYTAMHFSTEEEYFKRYEYPGAGPHLEEHEKFTSKVSEFQKGFDAGRIGLSTDVMNFLTDWLKKHILGSDKRYGQFLVERGVS